MKGKAFLMIALGFLLIAVSERYEKSKTVSVVDVKGTPLPPEKSDIGLNKVRSWDDMYWNGEDEAIDNWTMARSVVIFGKKCIMFRATGSMSIICENDAKR